MIKYSIIIPVYNEEKVIINCLKSLAKQTVSKEMETIVVDDGSTDTTLNQVTSYRPPVIVLRQNHVGPGAAKHLAAKKAQGTILVFADADMEFANDYVEKLCRPIKGEVIGSYSTQELLLNKDKPLARYWNLSFGRSVGKMEPRGYAKKPTGLYKLGKTFLERIEGKSAQEDKNKVFRAILKDKFLTVSSLAIGVGYTDDWTIAEKLNALPVAVTNAVYYHRSPETFHEVWAQARWFGKNEFLTKNLIRKLYNLVRYCPLLAITKITDPQFFKFKLVFNTAVFTSVLLSFFNENKNK